MRLLTTFMLAAAATLAVGCAPATGGLGTEAGPTSLPPGVALLESHESRCAGTVHISEDSVASDGLRGVFFVDPGQNATYRLLGNEVQWACIGEDYRDLSRMECPQGSTHVRVTRASEASEERGMLFECYG